MTDHRIAAIKALGYIPQAQDEARHTALASEATAHALLAIEARLGELVEQQRIANALIGVGHMGVFNSDAEIRPARNAVRRLLGLPVTGEA
ncbi:hypothetical protein ACWEKR_05935 [Nocardia sp. NPDC004573]